LKTEKFFLAKLKFRARNPKFDSDREVWVGNRTFAAGTLYPDSPHIYGILISINGLGQNMGEVLPNDRYGSLQLDATRGSFGAFTRIYDLLDKHTVINQDVELYAFEKRSGQVGEESDLDLEFVGKTSRAIPNFRDRTMVLEVRSESISTDTPLFRIANDTLSDQAVNDFSQAAESSIGKILPVVFGSAEVQPVFYSISESEGSTYAFFLTTEFIFSGFEYRHAALTEANDSKYYFTDGEYHLLTIPFATTPFSANTPYALPFFADFLAAFQSEIANAFLARNINAHNFLVLNVLVRYIILSPSGDTDSVATFSQEIFQENDKGRRVPDRVVASIITSINPVTLPFGTSIVDASSFPRPALLKKGVRYYFSSRVSDPDIPTNHNWWRFVEAATGERFKRDVEGDSSSRDWASSGAQLGLQSETIILSMNENTAIHQSNNASIVYLNAKKLASPAFFNRPYNDSDNVPLAVDGAEEDVRNGLESDRFIFVTNGLTDTNNVLGNGAGALITKTSDALRFLLGLSEFLDTESIVDITDQDFFNTTDFNDVEAVAGEISGAWEGGSIRSLIIDILSETSSRLAPKRNGSFRMWSYGVSDEPVTIINESDCTLESIEFLGEDTIVNKISVQYDKKEVRGGFRKALTRENQGSIDFFGVKALSEEAQDLNFVRDDAQAERWTDYRLKRFGQERLTVSLSIPYWKNNYRELELLDKIIISHIGLPSDAGSAPAHQEKPMTTDGDDLGADYNLGDLWRRAKSLPMRIIGRNPNFDIRGEGELELVLEVLEK
jgi:hypothetical protein